MPEQPLLNENISALLTGRKIKHASAWMKESGNDSTVERDFLMLDLDGGVRVEVSVEDGHLYFDAVVLDEI